MGKNPLGWQQICFDDLSVTIVVIPVRLTYHTKEVTDCHGVARSK